MHQPIYLYIYIHIYINIYKHTHTHTHIYRERERDQSINIIVIINISKQNLHPINQLGMNRQINWSDNKGTLHKAPNCASKRKFTQLLCRELLLPPIQCHGSQGKKGMEKELNLRQEFFAHSKSSSSRKGKQPPLSRQSNQGRGGANRVYAKRSYFSLTKFLYLRIKYIYIVPPNYLNYDIHTLKLCIFKY